MNLSNVVTILWLVVFGALAIIVMISFPLSNRVKTLFQQYGSTVLPDSIDLVSVNTVATNFQLQKYFLTKAYENEMQPKLRSIGKIVRAVSIFGIALTVLGFIITAVAIWVSVTQ